MRHPGHGWKARAALAIALAIAGATVVATAPAAAAGATATTLGDFETGTSPWSTTAGGGATASLSTTSDSPGTGTASARVTAAVPAGTAELFRSVPSIDARSLTLQVRSTALTALVVRLTDSTGQAHQQTVPLTAGGQWQTLSISQFAGGTQYSHWGGANDGVWHGPLTQLSLLIDSFRLSPGPSVTLDVDQVVAQGAAPPLAIQTTTLGNAFTEGATVSFDVQTAGTLVAWTARDTSGSVVATGNGTPANSVKTVSLGALPAGWYTVNVSAKQGDGSVVRGGTDISVLPASTLRERRIGAATHYSGPWVQDSIPLLGKAGLGFARDEAYWSSVEKSKGVYDFSGKIDSYTAALRASDVDHLNILDYGNTLYYPDEAPSTDAQRTAFANYAAASLSHFGTAHTAYEAWNEWNIRDASGPAGATAQNYAALLAATATKMRAVDPSVTIVGPALAPMNDWQTWLDQFIAAGGLSNIDAFSTHPYNFTAAPEVFMDHVNILRQKLDAAGHADMPIWFTEQGWYTTPTAPGVTPAVQAQDLARAQLLALGEGIGRYTVYDFKDDGTTATDPEHNFGIIRNDADPRGAYTPKPAFVAEGILTRQTADRAVDSVLSLGSGNYGVRFGARAGEPSGTRMEALWALSPQTWSVAATGPVTVTDLYGSRQTLTPDASGAIHVGVGTQPVYLTGPVGSVTTSSPFGLTISNAVAGVAPTATWHIANTGSTTGTFTLTSGGKTTTATVAAGETKDVPAALPAADEGAHTWTAVVTEGSAAIARLSVSAQVDAELQVTGSHALSATGADVLRLHVTNRSDVTVQLGQVAYTVAGTTGTTLAGVSVAAGSSVSTDVPFSQFGSWSATATAGSATATTSGTLAAAQPVDVPFQAVQVDGSVDPAVTHLPAQHLGADEQTITGWTGPADLSGDLWLTHDDSTLYITARMTDDTQYQPARAADIWQGDSMQIGVSPGWPGESRTPVSEIGTALTSAGPTDVARWLPVGATTDGITSAVARDDSQHTTTYELAIPYTSLGATSVFDPADRVLAATVAFNDNDGTVRRGWSSWGKGVAESKDPTKFHALRLMPVSAAPLAVTVAVREECRATAAVATVTATNRSPLTASVSVATAMGEKSFPSVLPHRSVTAEFTGQGGAIAAGKARVNAQAIHPDNRPSYFGRDVRLRSTTCG
ncbi:sugar-binding protein [Leifsonia sp. 21MFCrub1.1]|uniref:sugar-binding protein n=1 Tax=Leifsonia sp. 21MFCrub1.1 TaxID=1798223 RepID=UPI0008929356|nr:sugar-binding protein [Leifsonia sp. 21MFCrub1.1]SEB10049.1 Glycosyl hydrolases family 39 [Leifsonia sp. 21MFCrub1.1]